MGPGVETELKFQVPPGRRDAVLRALAGTGFERVRMAARYFDTPDARLAAAGLALRLRREGRARWVQTLKGRSDGLMQRLEHEVVLGARERLELDLARHDGTPAGARLREALGGVVPVERFATDIARHRRRVRTRGAGGSAWVELAFDEGHVRAGDGQRAVCELEFELIDGEPAALLALAARWVARHGLWLDVRSKAEVGHRLASALPAPAVTATTPIVSARMGPRRALAALLQSCLAQVLPNAAALAGPLAAGPQVETLHQLRVGLRRLRTALREFGRGVPGVDAAWDGVLAETFRALGAQRDRDVIGDTLAPALLAAQEAGLQVERRATAEALDAIDATAMLRGGPFNTLLLGLIGFVLSAAPHEDAAEAASLSTRARERLKRLHRQVTAQASAFGSASDADRHRLRKRAKRLRYTLEFCAPLFGRKAGARYLGLLRGLQQVLGDLNDLVVADAWLAREAPAGAGSAFLRGWAAARRETLVAQGSAALQALARAKRPWA